MKIHQSKFLKFTAYLRFSIHHFAIVVGGVMMTIFDVDFIFFHITTL